MLHAEIPAFTAQSDRHTSSHTVWQFEEVMPHTSADEAVMLFSRGSVARGKVSEPQSYNRREGEYTQRNVDG